MINWSLFFENEKSQSYLEQFAVGDITLRNFAKRMTHPETKHEVYRIEKCHGSHLGRKLARKAIARRRASSY